MGVFEQFLDRLEAIEAKVDSLTLRPTSPLPDGVDHGPRWLDTKAAAAHVGMSHQSLALYRSKGERGPRFSKVGGVVKYDREDLDAWLEAGKR